MSLIERALAKVQRSRQEQAQDVAARAEQADVRPSAGTPRNGAVADSVKNAPPNRTVLIDRVAIRDSGLLPPEDQERQIADQYRQIKRPLIAGARKPGGGAGVNPGIIMVTSALPGDGKTFTAINLALSMANEKDFHVLLIDADVAKPHISRLLGIDGERGLLDALRDETLDIESLIMPTNVPNLSVLSAGPPGDSATELLASERMRHVVRGLLGRGATRLVVVDSPPLLLTNESRVLADSAGQVVVVVKAGKTLQRDLRQALGHLNSSRQSINLVLNQSINESTGDYYGYGEAPRIAAAVKPE